MASVQNVDMNNTKTLSGETLPAPADEKIETSEASRRKAFLHVALFLVLFAILSALLLKFVLAPAPVRQKIVVLAVNNPAPVVAKKAAVSATVLPTAVVPVKIVFADTAEKVAKTPHFWQLDPRGGFQNGGQYYCCPVAVSDSLVYLARHGFPELLPKDKGVQSQIGLINLMASPRYLGTDPEKGTGPDTVLNGVENYVVGQGYQCSTMEYEGWHRLQCRHEEFVMGTKTDLDWLKKGVRDPHGVVWLNVGWYTRAGEDQWKRTGGHWVTMTGFAAADARTLLIDNPSTPGNGDQPDDPANDVVHLQPVDAGTLYKQEGMTQDAAGMYMMSGPGLPMGHDTVAFLDGAIVLVVGKL